MKIWRLIEIIKNDYEPQISDNEKKIIKKIIKITKDKSCSNFVNLVYSTFPILTSEKYFYLNLIEKAKRLKELKKEN